MKTALGSFVVSLALATPLAAQTVFSTQDYRQDRERWTDPAYYLHNTARQLTDMQVENRFGQKGSGADKYNIRSPYPFRTSREHYDAWLKTATGGTKHMLATLPDWDGVWNAGASWLDSNDIQASTIAAALTPQYREYYVQQVKARGRNCVLTPRATGQICRTRSPWTEGETRHEGGDDAVELTVTR